MNWPSKKEIERISKLAEKKQGTLLLSPTATPLEKLRWDICQQFLKYKMDNDLNQKELAIELEIDEAKVSKILHHRIKEFSTDRLIKLCCKIDPSLSLKVS